MDARQILDMIVNDYPWEQVLYKIIAIEALDPWDIDLNALTDSFVSHIKRLDMLDFKIPAKYVIIAAILLRMKSDHLHFLEPQAEMLSDGEMEPGEENGSGEKLDIAAFDIPSRRQPRRKVMVEDLVRALKRAMSTEQRRYTKLSRATFEMKLTRENISQRIESLYRKIDSLMARLKKEEVQFSSIVPKWEREEVVNAFLPLIYLDHEKKVACRQEKYFDEIFVKKREN
ncbi:MAG: segregation/condensation protein A [Candidatus Aenigmarchaeota archaeon]|nr:segregation/condensation protein A [Candidatus Aenigmarchaeota archaeon]